MHIISLQDMDMHLFYFSDFWSLLFLFASEKPFVYGSSLVIFVLFGLSGSIVYHECRCLVALQCQWIYWHIGKSVSCAATEGLISTEGWPADTKFPWLMIYSHPKKKKTGKESATVLCYYEKNSRKLAASLELNGSWTAGKFLSAMFPKKGTSRAGWIPGNFERNGCQKWLRADSNRWPSFTRQQRGIKEDEAGTSADRKWLVT